MHAGLIIDYGVITPVGLSAPQTAASVRAGIDRFSDTPIYDKRFHPLVMSLLPEKVLPPLAPEVDKAPGLTFRQRRMLRLAAAPLQEAVRGVADLSAVPLFLATPEQLPERQEPVNDNFLEQLATQSGVSFDWKGGRLYPSGRAAGLEALAAALEYLAAGQGPSVLVGGVDSYLDLYLLGALDIEERILAPGVMDGFIPGEGAAFILLSRAGGPAGASPAAKGAVTPVVVGHEEGHLYSQHPYRGDALAAAFNTFFRAHPGLGPVREVYSAMNGENHWAKEWGVAFTRNSRSFASDYGMHHPADCYGDIGAASGIAQIILATEGLGRGYLRPPVLVTSSSDRGCRGVTVVTSVTTREGA